MAQNPPRIDCLAEVPMTTVTKNYCAVDNDRTSGRRHRTGVGDSPVCVRVCLSDDLHSAIDRQSAFRGPGDRCQSVCGVGRSHGRGGLALGSRGKLPAGLSGLPGTAADRFWFRPAGQQGDSGADGIFVRGFNGPGGGAGLESAGGSFDGLPAGGLLDAGCFRS